MHFANILLWLRPTHQQWVISAACRPHGHPWNPTCHHRLCPRHCWSTPPLVPPALYHLPPASTHHHHIRLKKASNIYTGSEWHKHQNSFKNMPTSHAFSLALFKYTCSDPAMLLLSCACLCNNSKWCLPSFFSPLYTMLLLQCFLLNITACGINKWGVLLREKHPFNFIKKRGWAYIRGWHMWRN